MARVYGGGYPAGVGKSPRSCADAEFIVRAVNAHDALLAALQRAVELFETRALLVNLEFPDAEQGEWVNSARDAIAKIEPDKPYEW